MRIAIVDDCAADRRELTALLHYWCAARSCDTEIDEFPCGEDFLKRFCAGAYDLLFLDIFMPGRDGMETARLFRRQDTECRLIFLTTSHTHAVESYEVRASHYLTKPLQTDRFIRAMDMVCRGLASAGRGLAVTVQETALRIPFSDILYLDSAARAPRLHLKDRILLPEERLGDLIGRLLADPRFLDCNRNLVVNMDHADRICGAKELILKNGEVLPVRQHGGAAVRRCLLDYSLRALREEVLP